MLKHKEKFYSQVDKCKTRHNQLQGSTSTALLPGEVMKPLHIALCIAIQDYHSFTPNT